MAINNFEAEMIAEQLRSSDIWVLELLERLCDLAGMHDEFLDADGETFEDVVYAAADKLGVVI